MHGGSIVLLSGGMDSATALAQTVFGNIYDVVALSFDYGQRHRKELVAARAVADHFGVPHRIQVVDFRSIGGSALTDDIDVPEKRSLTEMGIGIPPTYVPARNTIFLSFALALAEVRDAIEIVIGANHLDYSGYPDCRPEYYRAYEEIARLGTKRGVEGRPVRIRTPLIEKTKAQIVAMGQQYRVPWEKTWSCYLGRDKACGVCDSCQLRLKGFKEAGVEDPLAYEVTQ